MIRIENLIKYYGEKAALKGINLEIKKGEIFGLLGPNGAGKTTTIKILTGQVLPQSGKVEIMGKDLFTKGEELKPQFGVVPEDTNLYERLTVEQNLSFFCRLYQCDLNRIKKYLKEVQLDEERNTRIKNLSKGMKQKILLLRALLHSPNILFLDEPTSGLDPSSAESIHKILRKLNEQGISILLTSHNMEEVDKLCHRVAFLDRGEIVVQGNPEDLKLKYSQHEVRIVLDEGKELVERELSLYDELTADRLSRWLKEKKIKSIHTSEPTLADIFVRVTGRDL